MTAQNEKLRTTVMPLPYKDLSPAFESFVRGKPVASDGLYLIWSNEHRAWWRPNSRGYTMQLEKAGRYSRADALVICRIRDQIPGEPMPELPIREDDVLSALVAP